MDEEGESAGSGSSPRRLRACLFVFAKRTRKGRAASSSPAWPAGYRHRSHSKVYKCLLSGRAPAKSHTLRRSHRLLRVSLQSFLYNMWLHPVGPPLASVRSCRQPMQKSTSGAPPSSAFLREDGGPLAVEGASGRFHCNSHDVNWPSLQTWKKPAGDSIAIVTM